MFVTHVSLFDWDRVLHNSLNFRLRATTADMNKRKAVETAQTAADLKLHLDKYSAQLKEMQTAVAEKTSAVQQESFKYKRIQVLK